MATLCRAAAIHAARKSWATCSSRAWTTSGTERRTATSVSASSATREASPSAACAPRTRSAGFIDRPHASRSCARRERAMALRIANFVDSSLEALERKGNLSHALNLYNPQDAAEKVIHFTVYPSDARYSEAFA